MRKLFEINVGIDDEGNIEIDAEKLLLDHILPDNAAITKAMFQTVVEDSTKEMIETFREIGDLMESQYQEEKEMMEAQALADNYVPEVLN